MKTIRDKSNQDLRKLIGEKVAELASFRFGAAGAKVTNVKLGRNVRREIAQIKTVLRERELAPAPTK
ncbi:MAG: 50S ribosomal protein L29 [Candidatus Vogelbacteria bacterium CG10_big_fil_rev_8_21_14_0_10_50_13]|uniref:Large ribosomal subunit protein uL29 n=1 Tax=Candidatus Vogelbacteria bacterium CG10_big_fil_rev_8_21_14_0_10_50_13 TaxID=1975044 RepID=A0A2H0RG66_9BACT|nr:MAG: 50S ribosomal protein L29 [Candidatus Vogelbacteria bacterium CG10_big_fil_rev_8_21_14_0_10_50_13]